MADETDNTEPVVEVLVITGTQFKGLEDIIEIGGSKYNEDVLNSKKKNKD